MRTYIHSVCVCSVCVVQMKQLRANKRHETFMAKRNVGVEGTPPHLVVTFTYFLGGDHTNYKIYLDTERFTISENMFGGRAGNAISESLLQINESPLHCSTDALCRTSHNM